MKKRYTLFRYPSLYGSPKHYRFKVSAFLATLFSFAVFELADNKTGLYIAYWR